jgi:hypothetical protein
MNLEKQLILDESADIIIRNKQIIGWTFIANEQLNKLNLGTSEERRIVLGSIVICKQFQVKVKQLLIEFKDVFTRNYK